MQSLIVQLSWEAVGEKGEWSQFDMEMSSESK